MNFDFRPATLHCLPTHRCNGGAHRKAPLFASPLMASSNIYHSSELQAHFYVLLVLTRLERQFRDIEQFSALFSLKSPHWGP
jgi:hypothetical protein